MSKTISKTFITALAGIAIAGGLAGCGNADDDGADGFINEVQTSESASASPSSSAPSSAEPSAASTPSETHVPLIKRGDEIKTAINDSMNGSLGPAGMDNLSRRLQQDHLDIELDDSVQQLFSRTTHSRLTVATTVDDPTVRTEGDAIIVTTTAVTGSGLYEPGEKEQDGADRLLTKLRNHLAQKDDDADHHVFTFRVVVNDDHGIMSVDEEGK